VTVLFADVVGFTSLAERLDPEQVKRLVDRAFELLVADVESYGGSVDKLLGDGIVALFESRGDVVGAFAGNNVFTPALAKAVAQMGKSGEICAYGFDLGPAQQEALRSGDLTGALGQQPFLQGFWPVMQLYLQIDRGIAGANLDTRAQLVTQETVGAVGSRYEN